MKDLRTTNILLLIITVPVLFYILKILSFIFIPLFASMFIALLFLPLMRWLEKRKVHKIISMLIVIILILGGMKLGVELIKLSSREIMETDQAFFDLANEKITSVILTVENFFGLPKSTGENVLFEYFNKNKSSIQIGKVLGIVQSTFSMLLMTLFFVVLLLSGSLNLQLVMKDMLFKQNFTSVKTFMKIESDILKFLVVKFLMSFFTGVGFTIACYAFDVSFPIFWGLLAFAINFVQMVGSVVSVVLLTLFAFVEIQTGSTLVFFFLVIAGIQALFGGVLEPIFMGKTFSINVITILIMLMFWGYIWGVPGMIMSIPITVFLKIILEQFPRTKVFAKLISGPESILK